MVVSSQMPNITISFTVTDFTGNTASFDTLFCTSCLVQENVQDNIEDEEQEVTKDKEKGDDLNLNILIGVCIVLLLIIVSLMTRSPKASAPEPEKAPSGLPLKSEDSWISKYLKSK